jgi:hypothetical protein
MDTTLQEIDRQPSSTPSSLFRQWVVASALGLGLGMALFAAVAEGIEQSGILGGPEIGERAGHIIGLALSGAIFGLMQWRALRRHFAVPAWMVPGTLAGLMLGYIVGYELGGPPIDFVLAPALAGLFGGIAQWRALRRQARTAGWLPILSAAGFGLGGISGTAVAILGLGDALGGGLPAWIALNGIVFTIAGAVGGAITGALLQHLTRSGYTQRQSCYHGRQRHQKIGG